MTAAALSLVACGSGQPAATGDASLLKIRLQSDPATLDVTQTTANIVSHVFTYNVMEGLVELDKSGKPQPLLATKWQMSTDGLTYTFTLREGVKFHDGTPFNADAVAFNLNRDKGIAGFGYRNIGNVQSVTAVDPKTVEIKLGRPSSEFMTFLGLRQGVMVSPAAAAKQAESPVGTGPYKFVKWTKGEVIALDRNEEYWGEKPAYKKVEFKEITDENAALSAVQAGDVDGIIVQNGALDRTKQLSKDPNLKVVPVPSQLIWRLSMNTRQGPLANPKVRQAISMALDRKAFVDATFSGYAVPTCNFFSSVSPLQDNYCPYEYNPAKAKQLLAEAGYPNGFEMEMIGGIVVQPVSELVIAQLAEVGITVKNSVSDDAQVIARVFGSQTPDYQTTVVGRREMKPSDALSVCPPPNAEGYCDPQVKAHLLAADATTDPNVASSEMVKAVHLMTDAAFNVPLFTSAAPSIFSSKVTGFKGFTADFEFDLRSLKPAN
ncbi:ABC transporter substrate-binding protein [Planosporangium mesophilum]|nr:ABC transporter substrate-binding protein [Planosporangium mesophilum]NJC84393.1 ABC transporter substrate-binding protein [Planosporangium mesophilum]